MKITTSHSAVKNKIFLGFWFILFAGAILLANWIFRLPAQRADDVQNRMADTEKQIIKLTALHAEFLLRTDKEDNLFTSAGINAETEIRMITANIRDQIKTIKGNNHIERNAASEMDAFSASLSGLESGLNNLVLITDERGSRNKGIVSRWLNLGRNMLNGANDNNDAIRNNMSRINLLESEYLLNRDIKILQDISVLSEEIRNNLSMDDKGIVITDIDAYIVLTGNLLSIEKRMGHNDNQGIIPDLENASRQLRADFATLSKVIDNQLNNSLVLWTVSRWLIILVIIALFIMAFIKYFALVDPLRKIADFSSKIAMGEFPDDRMITGNSADMRVVAA
ncbi:hypothetical protein EHM76_07475 [bacterium]|nr:MAG: hypothetical protein EHM76_07475 [bacterium]